MTKRYEASVGEQESKGFPVYARMSGYAPKTVGYYKTKELAQKKADALNKANQMAKGGNMKKGQAYKMYEITKEGLNGQYSYYSDKQGKTIKADTREEILREIEKEKKMAKGGKMYAKGGMTEHGLKSGDKIVGKSGTKGVKVYNKQSREAGSINLDSGKRSVSKYEEGGMMAKGGSIKVNLGSGEMDLEDAIKMYENKIKSQGRVTNERDENMLKQLKSMRPKMAKGGKTKSKQDPPIIRGYVDDEPYEYGDGGTMNCWCYEIGGL